MANRIHPINPIDLLLLTCLLVATILMLASCYHDGPEAVQAEIDNQRHIAARRITYQGYNEYQQFIKNN